MLQDQWLSALSKNGDVPFNVLGDLLLQALESGNTLKLRDLSNALEHLLKALSQNGLLNSRLETTGEVDDEAEYFGQSVEVSLLLRKIQAVEKVFHAG